MPAIIFSVQHCLEAIARDITQPSDLEINRTIDVYRQIIIVTMNVWQGCFATKSACRTPAESGQEDLTSGKEYQIRSVAQSCPTLCDPMNRSTPGLPDRKSVV